MIKNRPIDLSSTNVTLVGSEIDRKCREKASNGEPAWKNAGKQVGIEAWRVNNFKLEQIPEKLIGSFYEGDSYIVLETRGSAKTKDYDIYFWLGKFTTSDEACVAAYKTVELDDHLGDVPIQHREVQGSESDRFAQLFTKKGGIKIMRGGYDTGFHHVEPEKYLPRLMRLCGTNMKNVRVIEVEMSAKSLNSSDVFILDGGLNVLEFIGKNASVSEKARAGVLSHSISDERDGKAKVITIDECDTDENSNQFWKYFGGKQAIAESAPVESAVSHPKLRDLYDMDNNGGKHSFNKLASGTISSSLLKSDQIYILDAGNHVYVWVGTKCPKEDNKVALQGAIDYLNTQNRPHALPLTRVQEHREPESFRSLLN